MTSPLRCRARGYGRDGDGGEAINLAIDSDKERAWRVGLSGVQGDMLDEGRANTPVVISATVELRIAAVLVFCFIGVVAWFDGVDFYHRHFFDTGPIVTADNAVRIVFVGIFSWLIYAPGAGVVALIMSRSERMALCPAERGVLGFGIGIGIWHAVMLILGVLNLYYRPVMVGLCLLVLVASGRHFAGVAVAGCRALAARFSELRQHGASQQTLGVLLIVVVAAWLLLRRGLYPGGGVDYYTHYFYYYLEVLKNHGLAPNDVWYHYYYSKGSGLSFLGMLLTDPEAPALTTFPCVVCAAVAIVTLAERMVPNSLWPATGASIYLLYYLIGLNNGIVEGGFQKDHEEIAALIVLTMWALCMERCCPSKPFRVMVAMSAIAAAIVTQAVGILLGLFVGLLAAWSAVRRRWRDMWGYGVVVAAIAGVVLAIFVLSYIQTGLAADQPLDLMLSFADVTRLDRWGVIPQIITIAWIEDNYAALAPPFGWGVFEQLFRFMRLRGLWPFLAGPLIAMAILRTIEIYAGRKLTLPGDGLAASFARATAARLAALLVFFVVIALLMGRVQNISFERLSTFFVPLLVLFAVAGNAWMLNVKLVSPRDQRVWSLLPLALLVGVLGAWQGKEHWTRRIPAETANTLRFLSGQLSLAEAYAHAESRYAFGGINPSALAAAQQVPYGTPIWSTNVDSYCMVPGCLIESSVSFKMSGRLDEIIGGDPELAKRLLQEAGLNHFIFMKDYRIIDLLPFSRLFAPETIGRYLGVKWSDGSTFLLTWIGPDTRPIGPDFLKAYARRRAEPDALRWFKFDELAPLIATIAPRMRAATQWGEAEKLLSWRQNR